MDAKQRLHPLDRLIADDSLFFLEAMVPFVDYSLKKPLVLFIKYRELMSILHCLDDRPYIESCGFDYHPGSTEDMISHMCNFLPGNFASSVKQMQQMMSMMEMMNMSEKMNMSGMSNMANGMQMQETYQAKQESFPPNLYPDFDGMFASAENSYNNLNSNHGTDLYESVLAILENESKE